MAIALVGSPTTSISSADVTSATLAPPAGYLNGDLLVFYAANGFGGTLGLNSTSGVAWTPGQTGTNSGNATHSAWWKISNGTEPATYTLSNGTASNLLGACLLYRGVTPTSPLKGSTKSNTASGYAATSTPAVAVPATITATDLELISYGSGANTAKGAATTTYTYPTTGWTSRVAIRSTGSGTNGYVTSLGVLEAIGGATIGTASVSGDTSSWITTAHAFIAAAAGAPPGDFLPFFQAPGHHEDELERRPSGLYVQRRRVFGYRAPSRVLALTG